MTVISDKSIRELVRVHQMIDPFVDGQVRTNEKEEKIISYGLSSYGYDARLSDEFKIFTNINSSIVDPKALDNKSLVDRKSEVCRTLQRRDLHPKIAATEEGSSRFPCELLQL